MNLQHLVNQQSIMASSGYKNSYQDIQEILISYQRKLSSKEQQTLQKRFIQCQGHRRVVEDQDLIRIRDNWQLVFNQMEVLNGLKVRISLLDIHNLKNNQHNLKKTLPKTQNFLTKRILFNSRSG